MHVGLTEMSIFSCFSLKNKPIQSLHFMPNERFIFLVGSYLGKADQWKCQVRIRYQVKALLIVEAFLLLNTVIFLCCCSHAWSLHYDKMGLGAGRGKRSISYLSGQLPHCLAVPPLFPSPFCCLVLKLCVAEIPHRPKECMKIRQKPWGPLPHRTKHRPFQKRTGWRFEDKRMKFYHRMETLLDGRGGWEESVYYLLFGEQKGYVRICALGKGSCLASAAIKSCPGPTWMAAHLGLSPGSWEVKSHPGSKSEQGLPGECPAADCTTQRGCSRKEVPLHSFGWCSCLYGDFTWKKTLLHQKKWVSPVGQPLDCSNTQLSNKLW